jgi:N6-adenosine-specific RNA methylase IME4/ParB-like chromosome segregation protein Spo0J
MMEVHPLADLFPLMEGAAFDDLVADIKTYGLREPIWTLDGKILDGRNRYRACRELRLELAPKHFLEFNPKRQGDPLAFVISMNLKRRHLDESQRGMVAARLETMKQGRPEKDANLHVSRDEAAAMLNVSTRTVAHAAVVRDRAAPELQRAVDQGKIAVSVAAKAAVLPAKQQREIAERAEAGEANVVRNIVKGAARQRREVELGAKQVALPEKRYGVILADPPWRFEFWSQKGRTNSSADNHYPTMTLDEIKALQVPAAEDCVLFLWATVPMLLDALDVMRAWGFVYKSHCVWVKDRPGTGYWFRNSHEVLLVGTKGTVPAPAAGTQYTSVHAYPVGAHSEKPFPFTEMIDEIFPTLPKLEMFARRPVEGWQVWGLEVLAEAPA